MLLNPNTGDERLDTAYKNFSIHASAFKSFEEFENYFNSIIKTDNAEYLNKWLLKVLFAHFKVEQNSTKLDELTIEFIQMCSYLKAEEKTKVTAWVKANLEKVKG